MSAPDFLEVENTLFALLQPVLTDLGLVDGAGNPKLFSFDQIREDVDVSEYAPGVIIEFVTAPQNNTENSRVLSCTQTWRCTVIADCLADTTKRAAQIAGPIIGAVIDAVNGYEISDSRVINFAGITDSFVMPGYAEYPIDFTVEYAQAGTGLTETL